jgi:hypothetical protein
MAQPFDCLLFTVSRRLLDDFMTVKVSANSEHRFGVAGLRMISMVRIR